MTQKVRTRCDDQHNDQYPCYHRRGSNDICLWYSRGLEGVLEIVYGGNALYAGASTFGFEDDVIGESDDGVFEGDDALGWKGERRAVVSVGGACSSGGKLPKLAFECGILKHCIGLSIDDGQCASSAGALPGSPVRRA